MLTSTDLQALQALMDEGKRANVYLSEPMSGLGLKAGATARVVSISGNTVLIKPTGVNDELPFEAEELLMTRPAEGKATEAASADAEVHQELEPEAPVRAVAAVKEAPAPRKAAAPKRKPAAAAAGVTVTISASADNEWTVLVADGSKRAAKPVSVAADAVERAVHELGEETAISAVDAVIGAARLAAAARVDELSRQLEEARRALEALGAAEEAASVA